MTFLVLNTSKIHVKIRGLGIVLKLGCVAVVLLACNAMLGYYSLQPRKNVDVLEFFPGAGGDGSRITWAHSTNSRNSLEDALLSKVMVLEADVSPSTIKGDHQLIMALQPSTNSDLTLDQWLSEVAQHRKGIKLNFRHIDVAVGWSIHAIRKHIEKIKFPVLLNADILQGPTNPISLPVNSEAFLKLGQSLPNSILSLGWTTFLDPGVPYPTYTDSMIEEMVSVLAAARVTQTVTFSIRACIAKNSVAQLNRLLDSVPSSTLTVWSSQGDPITSEDLMSFRAHFDIRNVYYDLSSPLREEFLQSISRSELR